MFSKSAVVLTLFAISARLTVATPPACLLKAINTVDTPSDLEASCGRDADKIQASIEEFCGDYTDAAMKAFKETCQEVGKDISSYSSGSHSSTKSSSHTTSNSASTTSAPYPLVYTSTYYDTECSCTKTAKVSSTGSSPSSTGFATGTVGTTGAVTGPAAIGSPIVPTSPIATGTSATANPTFTGAASRNLGSYAVAAVAGAGVLMAL